MRQGANKRSRGRGGRNKPHIPLRMQTFDSNGPDVRIRGNAWQVHERYMNMARDAFQAGDRIAAENFYQHADHYYRIINLSEESRAQHGGPGQQGAGPQGQGQPGPQGQPGGQLAAMDPNGQPVNGPGANGGGPGEGNGMDQVAFMNQDYGSEGRDFEAAPPDPRQQDPRQQDPRQGHDGDRRDGDRRRPMNGRGPNGGGPNGGDFHPRDGQGRDGQGRDHQGREHQGRRGGGPAPHHERPQPEIEPDEPPRRQPAAD